jgi:molybdenum cofactor cytidylyltransferase
METIPAAYEGAADGGALKIGPLWALVLAAGAGSRFGGDKLATNWNGRPLIAAALEAAQAAPVAGVIVLVRPGDEAVRNALPQSSDLRVVEVADWAHGMAATLRAGIAALPADCAGAYVFLGDMPRIPHAVLAPLAEAVRAGAPAATPVFEGQLGHPVLFSAALFSDLAALTGDRGARAVLERLGDRLARIPAPDGGVLFDVDRRADIPSL